jgi:hypothetical protein
VRAAVPPGNSPEGMDHAPWVGYDGDVALAHALDPRLDAFVAELEGYLPPAAPGPDHLGFAVPLRLWTGEGELRLITTLTSFATAVDVTLSELHLEAFLPADEPTAESLRRRQP